MAEKRRALPRPATLLLVVALTVILGGLAPARAGTVYVLNSGSFYGVYGGVGTGRGIGFRADSAFSISSLGIEGSLDSQSFDAQIYSSTDGHEANSLLTSATAVVGGAGFGFYDIPISYSFSAGSFYVFNWQPTASNDGWASALSYYNDSALPVTIGPVTLIDGVEGFGATDFSNSLHPNLRINTGPANQVPEPATLALMGLGLVALGLRRRK